MSYLQGQNNSVSSDGDNAEQFQDIQNLKEDDVVQFIIEKEDQQYDDAVIEQTLDRLKLEFIPHQNPVFHQGQESIPVLLQIETKKGLEKANRAPIDIVCVVDVSGSMQGEKLKLVQQSLRYIQKILSPDDRISIVQFSHVGSIVLPWTRNLPDKKKLIKKRIQSLKTIGSTNIASGVEQGLVLIKQRQFKNPVTCMFLLSDGQDDEKKGVEQRVQNLINKYQIQDTWVLQSFGYGKDHDAKAMDEIAKQKLGQFRFVENIQLASEHFLLSLSSMLSLYAKDVTIQLSAVEPFSIKTVFGEDVIWEKQQNGIYQMKSNYLINSKLFHHVFEINLPLQYENAKPQLCLQVQINGYLIGNNHHFEKKQTLELVISNQVNQEFNQQVELQYLKAKAGQSIQQALNLAQLKKYDDAIQMLNKLINEIEQSQFNQFDQFKALLENLKTCKDKCRPEKYAQEGQAYIRHQVRRCCGQQESISESDGWNEEEEEVMGNLRQGKYQLSRSNSSGEEDDEDLQQPKKKQVQKKQKKILRKGSQSEDSEGSDSSNELPSPKQASKFSAQNQKNVQSSQKQPRRRSNSYSEDSN